MGGGEMPPVTEWAGSCGAYLGDGATTPRGKNWVVE